MSLYPSLEDMAVDKMAQAESTLRQQAQANAQAIAYPNQQPPQQQEAPPAYGAAAPAAATSVLYPSLEEYMGISLSSASVAANMPVVVANPMPVVPHQAYSGNMQVAPVTGNDIGLRRAEVRQGVREVVLCKDAKGKMGLRVKAVNKGIFIAFVHADSPSSLAGLRFGDQILQIDGQNVAGWDTDKAMKVLGKCASDKISIAVRDRPYDRTLTLQKDSAGNVGFVFKENKITAIVKDSSAARNGVLIDHHMVEVNGQNVIGMKEKEIKKVFDGIPRTVTITIIPSFIYDHIVKSMGSSLLKKHMDHSVPDI